MDMKKLMEAKAKAKMDPNAKEAKMGVLSALKGEMQKMMGDDVKGLKQVTVASPDKNGLEEGLDKAKSMLGGHDMSSDDDSSEGMEGSDAEEASESPQDEILEEADKLDAKALDDLIKQLEAKKAEKLMK